VRPGDGGAAEGAAEVSAVMTPALGTADRISQDWATADQAFAHRIASLLRDLCRPGVNAHVTVHIAGESISVKLDPAPHRWLVDGSKMRRQG
jgi:hypothetical protein